MRSACHMMYATELRRLCLYWNLTNVSLSKLVAFCISQHMKWNCMPLCSMLPPKHEEVSQVQSCTVLEGAKCINLPFTLEAISWHPDYWMLVKLIYVVTHTFLEWLHLIVYISQGSLEKWASQVVLAVKNPPANARDMGSIPGSGRPPGGGRGNPLQYSCLENPIDRGAWWAIVHRVPEKSDTTEVA